MGFNGYSGNCSSNGYVDRKTELLPTVVIVASIAEIYIFAAFRECPVPICRRKAGVCGLTPAFHSCCLQIAKAGGTSRITQPYKT